MTRQHPGTDGDHANRAGVAPPPPVEEHEGPLVFVLRVGVTGHRDVADPRSATRHVNAVLDELTRRLSSTAAHGHGSTPVQLIAVASLAEGADRLFVRTVVERGDRYQAVLPYGSTTFRDGVDGDGAGIDCSDAASRDEFDTLLRQAESTWHSTSSAPETETDRVDGYVRASAHVIDQCDILVALWDGISTRRRGGTADTVSEALKKEVPVIIVPVDRRTHDAMRVRSESGLDGQGLAVAVDRFLVDDLPGPFARAFAQLESDYRAVERFNSTRLIVWPFLRRLGALGKKPKPPPQLIEGDEREAALDAGGTRAREALCEVERRFKPAFDRADVLAQEYRDRFRVLNFAVHFLGAIAVTLGASEVIFFSHGWDRLLLWFEALLLLLLLFTVARDHRRRAHDRWASCRALAEHLRIASHIAFVNRGQIESVLARRGLLESGEVGRTQHIQDLNLDRIMKEVWETRSRFRATSDDVDWLKLLLVEGWIQGQKEYHSNQARNHERHEKQLHLLVTLVLVVTATAALVHLLLSYSFGLSTADKIMGLLAVALPSIGAAFAGIGAQRDHHRYSSHFHRKAGTLKHILDDGRRVKDLKGLREVVRRAGLKMSDETHEWLEGMSMQSPDVPT